MTEDILFSFVIGTVLIAFFYFTLIAPAVKRRRFNRYGVRTAAIIKLVEKTMVNAGDGIYSKPVYRLQVVFDFAGTACTVSKIHAIAQDNDPPKVGAVVWIIVDPEKPTDIIMDL